MSLHRADVADWSKIQKNDYNFWQHTAERTNGIVTPGNFISLVGGISVVYGLLIINSNRVVPSLLLIIFGRLADILDGYVADKTGTKSPLGEGVDATIDKLLIAAVLIILLSKDVLPLFFGLTLFLHSLYNSCLSIWSKKMHRQIHPTLTGKLTTVAIWFCISAYTLLYYLNNHGNVSTHLVSGVALAGNIIFIVLGIISSLEYTRQYRKAK